MGGKAGTIRPEQYRLGYVLTKKGQKALDDYTAEAAVAFRG